MATFRPRLLEAETAGSRMDALCEFIEFWLGPRQPSYGESTERVVCGTLPTPLRRLYQFAGRWPHRDHEGPIEYTVPAFSHQDGLMALPRLKPDVGGRLAFLSENQGNWECLTLAKGEDPPVWCSGDQFDGEGNFIRGERLVCDSLSRFITTFVLQELTLGSRTCIGDDGLIARFASERDAAVPVWTDGPYVSGIVQDYHLWGDVLVGRLWGDPFFAANHDQGVEFLTKNQGPVNLIGLVMYRPWTLDIRPDGSACIRYLRTRSGENAEAPAGTFDFPNLLATITAAVSDEGHYERNAMATFHRKGQTGGVQARHLHDGRLATSLFRRALEQATEPNEALERLFASEWPL